MSLNASELKAYHRALCKPHSVRVEVAILTLEERPIESITPLVLTGQVTYDTTAAVTRMLSLEFLDPHHTLNVDTDTPSDGALFLDRLVRVTYTIWVEELARFVGCRVFTGVPWKLARNGAVVTVEAHGKERLALRPAWRTFHRSKGARKQTVLRALLADRAGEGHFKFGDDAVPGKLATRFTVGRKQLVWPRAKKLADSMNRQLYYDGRGACTLRRLPGVPLVTFKPGDDGALLSPVAVDTDVTDFINTVHFKGKKNVPPVVRKLRAANPASPHRLARNGVPGVIATFVENSQVKVRARAVRKADEALDRQGREVVSHTYDVLPFPHLDELDMVRVVTDSGATIRHRLTEWALPLSTEGAPPMTVGYTKRLTPNRARIRKR